MGIFDKLRGKKPGESKEANLSPQSGNNEKLSIENPLSIDGIATNDDGTMLIMLLSDGADWQDEHRHLIMLQNKINAYAEFVESKQYISSFPNANPESFVFQLHFLHNPPDNANKFLHVAQENLAQLNIRFEVHSG
jgi:hypothetical protein